MYSIPSLFLLALGAAAGPTFHNTGAHCGTTQDATLSDCAALVNDPAIWDTTWSLEHECRFGFMKTGMALQVACHGNCCVYVSGKDKVRDYLKDTTREEAQGLLGCGNTHADKINGLLVFKDHGVCFSNANGCADCFDDYDTDFYRRAVPEKRSVYIGRDVN